MATALIGDFPIGAQPLWPIRTASAETVFDRPPWERPTTDNPWTPGTNPDPEEFTGPAGFPGTVIVWEPPTFTGGPPDGSYWIPGSDADPLDGGTVVTVEDGEVISQPITASRTKFFRIEIRDADGDLVVNIPGWISGNLKEQLDKASELNFTVPLGAAGVDEITRPNRVWLRDRWGFVVNTFELQTRGPRGGGSGSYFDFTCLSAISQLMEEAFLDYAGADLPVVDHVAGLLALQEKTGPISLGTIDDEIAEVSLPFVAADSNIHAALLNLQAALPKALRGHIYVDPQRRLQWRLLIGDQREQVITRGRNVATIEAETRYNDTVNRVYLYGEGQDRDTRLSLVDAGEAVPYIEDTDSIATNGLRKLIKADRRIKIPATLLRVAQRILEEFSTPPMVVRVDLLDLAHADDAPDGWQDIYIGGKYRVVDTVLGVDTSIEIATITRDLKRPVPLQVDLDNQTRTLSDLMSSLIEGLYQPLDVLGDRYKNMGRNFSDGAIPDSYRAGDTRWNDGQDQLQAYDGTDWRDTGGGWTPFEAADYAELESLYPADDQELYALGVITTGADKYAWYEIADNGSGTNIWRGRTIWEAP